MLVGEFLEYCRARNASFSSPELNPLLGDNLKGKKPVLIESNKFLRQFIKSTVRFIFENVMKFIKTQNQLKKFMPMTLQVSGFQRLYILNQYKNSLDRQKNYQKGRINTLQTTDALNQLSSIDNSQYEYNKIKAEIHQIIEEVIQDEKVLQSSKHLS